MYPHDNHPMSSVANLKTPKKLLVDEYLDYYRELVARKIGERNIVFLQNGMFYEIYNYRCEDGPDLYYFADLLSLQLARKNKEILEVNASNHEMIGFPMCSLQKYVTVLLQHGFTIAVYHQTENGTKNVSRVLDQIISPSTNVEYGNQTDHNYLMCVYIEPMRSMNDEYYICSYSMVDLAIGNSYIYETSSRKGDFQYGMDKLYQIIKLYNPREIVFYVDWSGVTGDDDTFRCLTATSLRTSLELDMDGRVAHFRDKVDPRYRKVSYQNSFLGEIFKVRSMLTPIESLDLEKYPSAVVSYILLLEFAKQHRTDIVQKLARPVPLETEDRLILTQNSIYQLNIVPDKNVGTTGSMGMYNSPTKNTCLLSILCGCQTAFGKRMYREQLLNPHTSVEVLNTSYDRIERLVESRKYIVLGDMLSKIMDLERIHRRLALRILSPMEFNNMNVSAGHVVAVFEYVLAEFRDIWFREGAGDTHTAATALLDKYKAFISTYRSKIDCEKLYTYNVSSIERSIFVRGVFEDIDRIDDEIALQRAKLTALAKYMSGFVEGGAEGQNYINVSYNDKEGYYLELTKRRCDAVFAKIPSEITFEVENIYGDKVHVSFPRSEFHVSTVGTTCKTNRITGKHIETWSKKIGECVYKMSVYAMEAYKQTLDELDSMFHDVLVKVVEFVGDVDIHVTNARNAVQYSLSRPQIVVDTDSETTSKSYFKAEGLRHIIVEQIQTKTPFITNDISLGTDGVDMIVCYGYNAVGKTTMQKAICLAIIMAQSGGFVSARQFTYRPFHHIFTRISNVDNLLKNQSSFMVEMMELKYILKHASHRSMVCIDELVASTEYRSGIALVASTILEMEKRRSCMFMATHIHELSRMDEVSKIPTLRIKHLEVSYDENKKVLVYDRKLRDGAGTGLYGLEVARFLELDESFMNRAFEIRNSVLGNEASVFHGVVSNYNRSVINVACQLCGYRPLHDGKDIPLETHHIHFQCNADKDGNFKDLGFHKNAEHNLVALCRPCHQNVHRGNVEIHGYKATSEGAVLEATEKKEPPKEAQQYSHERMDIYIRNERAKNPKITKKDLIAKVYEEFGIRINYGYFKTTGV